MHLTIGNFEDTENHEFSLKMPKVKRYAKKFFLFTYHAIYSLKRKGIIQVLL